MTLQSIWAVKCTLNLACDSNPVLWHDVRNSNKLHVKVKKKQKWTHGAEDTEGTRTKESFKLGDEGFERDTNMMAQAQAQGSNSEGMDCRGETPRARRPRSAHREKAGGRARRRRTEAAVAPGAAMGSRCCQPAMLLL